MEKDNRGAYHDICKMAEHLQASVKDAIVLIQPEVDSIIRDKTTDSLRIERLLDSLLDCAGIDEDGLLLFKRLCRYYFEINPDAVYAYVNAYRSLYDDEQIDDP